MVGYGHFLTIKIYQISTFESSRDLFDVLLTRGIHAVADYVLRGFLVYIFWFNYS